MVMKFYFFPVYTVRSSWLGDVFNGLGETSVGDPNEEPVELSNDITHDGSPAQAIVSEAFRLSFQISKNVSKVNTK